MSSILMGWRAWASATTAKKVFKRFATAASIGLASFGIADYAVAGSLFTGQFGTGNTWNVYEAINTPFSFKDALAFAGTRPDPTGGSTIGNLVAIGSLEENDFLLANASGERWIGLTDRVGVAPGATESALTGDPFTLGWAWVTGEPFDFQNWNAGEPNNAGVGEDAVHLTGAAGLWNDNASGFGENDPEVDPDAGSTAEGAPGFGFIIEWRTNLATQPAGFPGTRPDPALPRYFPTPLTRLPGPDGTADAFGVREIRDVGNAGGGRRALEIVLSGEGSAYDGTAAFIDLGDPDDGAGAGPNQGSVPGFIPFISDIPVFDDNGIQSVIKGTFQVPEGQGGEYTFNVRSDDGFALRILSQATPESPLVQHKFTSARFGVADEDGSLVFLAPTGDSNTQGLINLQPGTYDVEFLPYEDGGGAFWEVSTAKGDYVNGFGAPRWLLLGDGQTLPGAGPFPQAAKLTGQVAVTNFEGYADIATVIDSFRLGPVEVTGTGSFDDLILMGGNGVGPFPATTIDPARRHLFPNSPAGSDIDNFSTAAVGQIEVIDTDGLPGETLTFGLFSDDNAALHIVGQDFTAAVGDGTTTLGTPSIEEDVWLLADFATGNTNARGLITLEEGTYQLEAFMLELGGGAGLQVWVAPGDHTAAGFNSGAFSPLTIDTLPDASLAANIGLGLVAGPGTGPIGGGGLDGDFNADGQVDGQDFLVWQRGGSPNGVSSGDLELWKANFGATGGGVAGVPEPGSLGLAALAIAGLAGCTRRRRS